MAITAFTPAAYTEKAVTGTSVATALPGSSNATAQLTNLGPNPVVALLGTSNAVVVTNSTGFIILPGTQIFVSVGSNTYIAMMTLGGGPSNSRVNITMGV